MQLSISISALIADYRNRGINNFHRASHIIYNDFQAWSFYCSEEFNNSALSSLKQPTLKTLIIEHIPNLINQSINDDSSKPVKLCITIKIVPKSISNQIETAI